MPSNPARHRSLEQVHELNRLFLQYLQERNEKALLEAGFPAGAIAALRAASAAQLDTVAEFPRTLFELSLREEAAAEGLLADPAGSASRVLEMTILFCAWNISRDSIYHARLFFGLTPRVIHTLRTMPVSSVPRAALTSVHVACAFSGAEWLWSKLLTETRPEVRRHLILVALQPKVDAPGMSPAAAFGRSDGR